MRHLGHFAEIEILVDDEAEIPAARAELIKVLTALGLSQSDVEPGPYILLIQAAHPVRYQYEPHSDADWPFVEIK